MRLMITTCQKIVARISLFLYYTLTILAAIFFICSWSPHLSFIEDILLYMPRWLILTPLLIVFFFDSSLIKKQKAFFTLTVVYLLFFYNSFNIPRVSFGAEIKTTTELNIMTANLGNTKEAALKISDQINKFQLSIIALQETSQPQARQIIPKGWDLQCAQQMCLASAYPVTLVNSKSRRFLNGWGNIGALFTIKVKNEIINIVNIHLETPRKGFEDFQLSKLNFQVLVDNSKKRYVEATVIHKWVKKYDNIIILGDFNMPVESSIYNDFFSEYENSFNTKGIGLGHTKHTRLHGVRIDHILVDDNFQTLTAEVGDDFGGDHRPMIAKLAF